MFSLQNPSQLRRAEPRKLDLTVFNSFFCIEGNSEGVPLNTRSLEISEKLLANIRNLFRLLLDLFDVYLPRSVCSSRLLPQVPRASQVMNFSSHCLIPRHDLASSRPLSSRGFLKKCPFSKPPNLPFCTANINNIIAIGFLIV